MKLTSLPILLLIIMGFSCKRSSPVEENVEDARKSQSCGKAVVANASNFATVTSDAFTIMEASISGDCLTLKLGLASGCTDPASLDVLHGVSVATVYPQQHALKIALTYGVGCAMPGTRTYHFDLYPIRQKNTNKISVSISGQQGYYKTLEYKY
ncbi:hypothetical protein U0035_10085 [Niabella yanshanensis]|uniref:Lipoprotein n=1 Tax=Niabella yanshanensis TaxID=577386 RepID=A0ABZ0WCZ8_9BACT|nr:hypothetical protein [Niabella yanshanensis]WQD40496.1 hypothetical protein U0035_10085 [Niabella yanshanensis]